MDDAKGLWFEWQSLLSEFPRSIHPGRLGRFAQLGHRERCCAPRSITITQFFAGLGLECQWRNVEHFAEYGSWIVKQSSGN